MTVPRTESTPSVATTLYVRNPSGRMVANCPIRTCVCFARSMVDADKCWCAVDGRGQRHVVQAKVLATWPDQSVKWMLVDFLARCLERGESEWRLVPTGGDEQSPVHNRRQAVAEAHCDGGETVVATGQIKAVCQRDCVRVYLTGDAEATECASISLSLARTGTKSIQPVFDDVRIESSGPVRATVLCSGRFSRCRGLRFALRTSFYAETGLIENCIQIHNPVRAKHRGGLWDLGDPGSIFFDALDLCVRVEAAGGVGSIWSLTPDAETQESDDGTDVALYQDSSGGENWNSRNHVNRDGRVPCRFRGYRFTTPNGVETGNRANPVVAVSHQTGTLAVAVPEFWQQFPSSLGVETWGVRVGLFPHQWDDQFELQAGERKTQTVWIHISNGAEQAEKALRSLEWVHDPAVVRLDASCYEETGAIPHIAAKGDALSEDYRSYIDSAVQGKRSFFARREIIDEYGWRNYGDFWADHEQNPVNYQGPIPIISHYNNQYDAVFGLWLHFIRTGNAAWYRLFDALARHVIDIDIYHTQGDRPPYSGGLFWHTDHYKDAGTCTHRGFSRQNRCPGEAYGGGPSNEHNYTTGLLYHYYLTGNTDSRDAVLTLAEWVVRMDESSSTGSAVFDPAPTGYASATADGAYHGPGRGAANSITCLLDAWLLTDDDCYLEKAEALIQRVVHPEDDIDKLDLLNTELRWSYTVFLGVLGSYAQLKIDSDQRDNMFEYAAASLVHYGKWMLEHEVPYFDRPEQLEFPTEAWAAQEMKKANALYCAAMFAEQPLAQEMRRRAGEFSSRAWRDLMSFDSADSTRALVIAMVEGLKGAYFGARTAAAPRILPRTVSFPKRIPFVTRRQRIKMQLRSARGLVCGVGKICQPTAWARLLRSIGYRL